MITKALVKHIEKKHSIDLLKSDVDFLDAYQKHSFDARKAYTSLPKFIRDEKSLVYFIQRLKNVILDIVEANLIMDSGKATRTISELMEADKVIPQANIKLEAAKTTLDRVGLGKKDTIQIGGDDGVGLFIIPSKKPVELEEDIIEGEIVCEGVSEYS